MSNIITFSSINLWTILFFVQ